MSHTTIKDLIETAGFNTLTFAKQININAPTLYKIVSGATPLDKASACMVVKIARGLNMTTDELLTCCGYEAAKTQSLLESVDFGFIKTYSRLSKSTQVELNNYMGYLLSKE